MRFKPKKENAFGLDLWNLVDKEFSMKRTELLHKEAAFAQGNGFIGIRCSYDEPVSDNEWESMNACFLNGSFEYEDILYTYRRPGLNPRAQLMLRIPDWQFILLTVDGEEFCMPKVKIVSTERIFSIENGIVSRSVVWQTKSGKKVSINSKRFISLTRQNSCLLEYKVSINQDAEVSIKTEIDGDIKNLFSKSKYLKTDSVYAEKNTVGMELVTERSEQRVVMASSLLINSSETEVESQSQKDKVVSTFSSNLAADEELNVGKFVNISLTDTNDKNEFKKSLSRLKKDQADGFSALENEHCRFWKKFWKDADLIIEGDDAVQQGIRYCIMQLIQNSGKDGKSNIGAKGLTGYNYSGKCFWDTEIYMQPVLLNAKPELTEKLIDFRYNTLGKARELAKFSYLKGALYPWETINGEESSFIYEAATAQYHLQCAIGLSIKQYLAVTDNFNYIAEKGLEILIETSRCLFDVGAFIPARDNKFCMNCVCGPDEYSPMVDNNCYTNTMTMHHFDFSIQMLDQLEEENPSEFEKLKKKLKLESSEIENWKRARDNMHIPYSEKYGIHLQDDQFLYRDPVNLKEWMKTDEYKKHEIHPLNLFRKQLLKQADIILLMVLRSKDYSTEQKCKNYEFYEPKTINDSSLSPCAYSIVAGEIGKSEDFIPYLKYTCRMDIDNYQGTESGIHTASMGGAWLSIIQGVAGIIIQDGKLHLNPMLPPDWRKLEFKYRFNNSQINISVNPKGFELKLLQGKGFSFNFNNQTYMLNKNNPVFSTKLSQK